MGLSQYSNEKHSHKSVHLPFTPFVKPHAKFVCAPSTFPSCCFVVVFYTVSGSGRVHLINWLINLCFFFLFFWGIEENSMPEPACIIKVLKADVYFLWSIRQANQLKKLHTWSINRPWASLILKEWKHQVKRVVSPFWWKKNGTSLTEANGGSRELAGAQDETTASWKWHITWPIESTHSSWREC